MERLKQLYSIEETYPLTMTPFPFRFSWAKNNTMKKLKLVKQLSKLNTVVGLGLLVLGVVYLNDGDNLGWLFIWLSIATSADDIIKVFKKN